MGTSTGIQTLVNKQLFDGHLYKYSDKIFDEKYYWHWSNFTVISPGAEKRKSFFIGTRPGLALMYMLIGLKACIYTINLMSTSCALMESLMGTSTGFQTNAYSMW